MTTTTNSNQTALGHLKVVELGGGSGATALAGRLLGDMGADVILVEPPGGVGARDTGPFAHDVKDSDHSLAFLDHNINKRSVTLDIETTEGQEAIKRLASWADVLIESYPPGRLTERGLAYADLSAINPRLVYGSLTPFGQSGPYRDYAATELTIQSLAGDPWVYGDDERAPAMVPGDATARIGSMHLVLGILMALRERRWSARGQHIDVSRHDVGVWQLVSGSVSRISGRNEVFRRPGKASTGIGSIYYCADGIIQVFPSTDSQFRGLVTAWMQDPSFDDAVWDDVNFRRDNFDLVDGKLRDFFATRTVAEIDAGAARHNIPLSPVSSMAEFAEHPHTRERGFIINANHPVIGDYRAPGAPYRFSETPWVISRPAPRIDEHGDEVREMIKGLSSAPFDASTFVARMTDRRKQPLEGVRIVDLSRVFAGPFGTMLLAFHGAEVIRLESEELPAFRQPRQPNFPELNRNKLACTIDMRSPEGVALIKRLVAQSDVVFENFRPTVMERMGLSYEELRKIRPNVIMASMSGYGTTGPMKDRPAFGQILMSFGGLSYMWGHPESDIDTRPKNAYSDFVLGAQAAMAVVMALEHRDQTGQGQHIESSHVEGLVGMLGPEMLSYLVNGVSPQARGNASDVYAPHGVYPCIGFDAWISIAIENDAQWARLVGAMDNPTWAHDARFETHAGRLANRADLDERIGEWTATRWAGQTQMLLQPLGIPCGAVQNPLELLRDPQLRHRGTIVTAHHDPEWWGTLQHPGLSVHLSDTPGWATDSTPLMGQDNDRVYKQILGLTETEIAELTAEGILR